MCLVLFVKYQWGKEEGKEGRKKQRQELRYLLEKIVFFPSTNFVSA